VLTPFIMEVAGRRDTKDEEYRVVDPDHRAAHLNVGKIEPRRQSTDLVSILRNAVAVTRPPFERGGHVLAH